MTMTLPVKKVPVRNHGQAVRAMGHEWINERFAQMRKYYDEHKDECERHDRDVQRLDRRNEQLSCLRSYLQCGVPMCFRDALITDGSDIPVLCDVRRDAMRYVQDVASGQMRHMILTGKTGTGKSYTGAGMLRRMFFLRDAKKAELDKKYCIKSFCSGIYATASDIVDSFCILNGYKSKTKPSCAKYVKSNLLVIDEIGRERHGGDGIKAVEQNALFYVLDARYSRGLSTACITNMTFDDFSKYVGDAFMSRMSIGFMPLDTAGVPDLRQNKRGV